MVALLTAGITRFILHVLHVHLHPWAVEIAVDGGFVFVPAVVVSALRIWGAQRSWRDLEGALLQAKASGRPILIRLIQSRLKSVRNDVEALARTEGLIPNLVDLWRWLDDFFRHGGRRYVGVDSHVPTECLDQYKTFLEIHERALSRAREEETKTHHTRVIVATRNELSNDYFKDSAAFLEFIRWHQSNGVALKWIEPSRLRRLAKDHKIAVSNGESHVDIALWEHYAVLFEYPATPGAPTLRMRFPQDAARPPLDPPYEQLAGLVGAVRTETRQFPNGPPGLEVVSQETAQRWPDYVDVSARLRDDGPLAKFLLRHLQGSRLVFDAAAGLGCEAILLQRHGIGVVCNEVDENLRDQARRIAAHHDVKLDLRQVMWEQLADGLEGSLTFDAVLCLGNSICLVPTDKRINEALHGFRSVLKDDGLLLIDERNFGWLVDHRAEVLRDPTRWPHRLGDVMYSGNAVRGFPREINQAQVNWILYDNAAHPTTLAEIDAAAIDRDPLVLRAFRPGALYGLLERAGFEIDAIYCDLVPAGNGRVPNRAALGESAFVTYVARKVGTRRAVSARDRHRAAAAREESWRARTYRDGTSAR
jgi:SAM-dependent methyltransferase